MTTESQNFHMAIHERLKGMVIGKGKGKTVEEIDKITQEFLSGEWAVGENERGMGRSNYAALHKATNVVMVECPCWDVAEHIVKIHNESLA